MSKWWTACLRGLAVTLFAACVLSIAAGYFFPQWTDPYPPPSSTLLGTLLGVAIWVVSAGLGVLVVWLSIRRARERGEEPRCPNCGYALSGLRDARCPECGNPFDASWLSDNSKQ
jgi:hypothetical protein